MTRVRIVIAAMFAALTLMVGVAVPAQAAATWCRPVGGGDFQPLQANTTSTSTVKTWKWSIWDFTEYRVGPDTRWDARGVYANGTRIRDIYTSYNSLSGYLYDPLYNGTFTRTFGGKWSQYNYIYYGNTISRYCNTAAI